MDGYSYVLELVDQISGPAKKVSDQIAGLTKDMQADAKAVNDLRQKMSEMKAAGELTADAEKKLTGEIAKKTAEIEKDAKSIRKLVASEAAQAKAAKEAAAAQAKAVSDASGLANTLETLGPYAEAAAAGFLAIGAAVAGALIGGAALAIHATEFKNQTTAALQSAVGTREAASEAFEEIRKISDEVGISDARAQKMGLALLDAGIERDKLGDTLKSIALLEKVRGEEASGKLEALIKKSAAAGTFALNAKALSGTGISEKDVVGELATKLGKSTTQVEDELKKGKIKAEEGIEAINAALGKENLQDVTGVGEVAGKIQEQFSRLFEDVNTKPLLDALKAIGGWFDKSTVTGNALHFMIQTVFDAVFSIATTALPYVQFAFNEVVIIALKLYIALKPVIAYMKELFASTDSSDIETVITDVLEGITGIAAALVVVVGGIIAFQAGILYALVSAGMAVLDLADTVENALGAAWDYVANLFSGDNALEVASALINGLVNGISGGAGLVIAAVQNLGTGAIAGIKGVLGIHSPSAVMQDLGGYTSEGFTQGVNSGADDAQAAMSSMATPPAAATGGRGAGVQVTIAPGAIAIAANGANAEAIRDLLEGQLRDMLEGILLELGGGQAA